MKVCRKCNKELSEDFFHKHPNYKDGLNNVCKECRSKDGKQYYQEHIPYYRKWRKEYYDQNKDIEIEKIKEYYKRNPDKKKLINELKKNIISYFYLLIPIGIKNGKKNKSLAILLLN